jgi:hypothetical protein
VSTASRPRAAFAPTLRRRRSSFSPGRRIARTSNARAGGAAAYVTKDRILAELVRTIRSAAAA